MTKALNHATYLLLTAAMLLAALPPEVLNTFPAQWKPYVVTASAVAMWIKGHKNLFVNPDGTPAQVGYQPPQK